MAACANLAAATPAALPLLLLLLLLHITDLSHAYGDGVYGHSKHIERSWPGASPPYVGPSSSVSRRRENEVYPEKPWNRANYRDENKGNLMSSDTSQIHARNQQHGISNVNAERPGQSSPPLDRPTLRPAANFNPREDAEKLREALGKTVKENVIISIMTKRTDIQRQEIANYYPNLKKDLGWKLSFGFRELMKALATPLPQFQAEQLKEAFRFSTRLDEDLVIELLCTLNNRQLSKVREFYKRLNRKDLNDDLTGFSLNPFAKFLVSYTQGNRDERNNVDLGLATYDAQQMKNSGTLSINNNSPFKKIMISRSFPQLRLTFMEYKRIAGRNIKDSIRKDFTGNVQKGLLNIVKTINNRANYFAEILNGGIKTFSKRDATLIRVIVVRAETDMEDIKSSYHQLYNIPLASAIPTNTGTMKKALLSLISG